MKEIDMYPPLKKFLLAKGYRVHSEVADVDVMAEKDGEVLIVEMKTSFNLQLIYQLMERLKLTDRVYAYVPLKKGGRWPKPYKKMCALLKRLHCGLITLDQHDGKEVVIEFDPVEYKSRKNYTKKNLALKEFEGRSVDLNVAGSTGTLLFTAYKEKAIRIALFLAEFGPTSTTEIRDKLEINEAVAILNKNHFSWYERVSRGKYRITPEFEFFRVKYQHQIKQLWL